MRSYIFTEIERSRLEEWLKTHKEDNETQKLFTEMRRNFASIKRDIELYSILAKSLERKVDSRVA